MFWSSKQLAYEAHIVNDPFGFRKKRDCTVYVAKTKALISFAVTAKMIRVFVFAYAKSRFSHNAAHILTEFFDPFLFHSFLSVQDSHGTRIMPVPTRDFLANNNVKAVPYSVYSPDCNPIEHIWDVLGRRVRKRQRQPNNVRELAVALREEWIRLLRNLCGSMRLRLDAVVANRG